MQDFQLCPYCGQPLRLVWVHGHGQCAVCHTNVDECCRGESQEAEGVRARSKSLADSRAPNLDGGGDSDAADPDPAKPDPAKPGPTTPDPANPDPENDAPDADGDAAGPPLP